MTTKTEYLRGAEVLAVIDVNTPRGRATELYVKARAEGGDHLGLNHPLFYPDGIPMRREDKDAITAIKDVLTGNELDPPLQDYQDRIADLVMILQIVTDRLVLSGNLTKDGNTELVTAARSVINGDSFEIAMFEAFKTSK